MAPSAHKAVANVVLDADPGNLIEFCIMSLPAVMTAQEVADAFRVSRSTIYRWVDDGIIRPINLGVKKGAFRFRVADIERLLEAEEAVG